MGLLSMLLALVGCDSQKISELTPGESTEADVRAKFGTPTDVWEDADGRRVLEFSRQPEGARNWQMTIDAQGKLLTYKNVLTPENLARLQPGMSELEVRRLVGKPGKVTPYPLKQETTWDYRFLETPSQTALFVVTFTPDGRVKSTARLQDPKTEIGQ
ncbi:MAG: outer membrane protein assembly factor BamE [Betaproteobacteria bacterium]|nr:outer membrane protein assembly factor BamE [Betaproteobacteria bacterium]MDE2047177.1 outer membrane protein assembly factor BamE [Betaproteobacteria bacterium]